jgi:hypothetical protein
LISKRKTFTLTALVVALTATALPGSALASTAQFSSPAEGAQVRGTVTLTADFSGGVWFLDERSLSSRALDDGNLFRDHGHQFQFCASGITCVYSFGVDTTSLPDGRYTFQALAYGPAIALTAERTVTVDNTAPAASIEGITGFDGESNVTVDSSASDANGIASNEWFIDSVSQGSGTSFELRPSELSAGRHMLELVATDPAGNASAAASATFDVASRVTAPAEDALVHGTVTFTVAIFSSFPVNWYDLNSYELDNGDFQRYEGGSPFLGCDPLEPCLDSKDIDTTRLPDGRYRFVFTPGPWPTPALSRTVTVDNLDDLPSIGLTAPAVDATVTGELTFAADASDDRGLDRVEFLLDGAVVATDETAPYTATVPRPAVGAHTLRARATDSGAQTALSASRAITVPAPFSPPAPTDPAPAPAPEPASAPAPELFAAKDTLAPTKPASPAAKIKGRRLQVSFGRSTDNVKVMGYRLFRGGTAIATSDGLSFELAISMGEPGTLVLELRAFDAAGNESDPVVLTMTRYAAPKVPKVKPAWAWKLSRWKDAPTAKRGIRPHTPNTLPKWYEKWNAWHKAPVKVTIG